MFWLNKPTDSEDTELFRAVQTAIDATTDVEMNAGAGERIRARVTARAGSAPVRRTFAPRRAFAVTAGAAMVAIVAALLFPTLRPGVSPADGTAAYARVEKAMEQVRYAQWTQTERSVNKEGENAIVTIEKTYARLDGANSALVQDDVDRIVFGAKNHYPALWKKKILFDKRGRLLYYYDTGKYVFAPLPKSTLPGITALGKMIYRQIYAPPPGSRVVNKRPPFSFRGIAVIYHKQDDTGWAQFSERDEKGKTFLVFRGKAALHEKVRGESGELDFKAQYEKNIWVDPETMRVVRSEYIHRMRDSGGFDSTTTCDNFVYNVPPPAGTFDWKMPAPVKKRK